MPKTKDAFAFRRLYKSLLSNDEDFQFQFLGKKLNELEEKPCFDEISNFEQSIRVYNYCLNRADFLFNLVKRHICRLEKFSASYDVNSIKWQRCCELSRCYNFMLKSIYKSVELYQLLVGTFKASLHDTFNKGIGNRLKLARRRKEMKQEEVASILGVKKAAYSHYELGRREIPPLFLYKLAKLFDVPADWLLMVEK